MAMLKITPRQKLGTRAARRLRLQEMVPGIIYGHGRPNEAVSMSRHDIELAIQHGQRLVTAKVGGKEQNFLIKDVQYDYLGQSVIHVDLARVRLDERVEVTVPIDFRGTPVGVETEEGVLNRHLSELRLECVVTSIPEDIRVSVNDLHVNDSLRVADLQLPPGVRVLHDADTLVASVTVVVEEVTAPAEAAEAAAEPELIGEKPQEQAPGETEPGKDE